MSVIPLDAPFLEGALRSTNFFNGRVLSREDMQRDRDAEETIHGRLGRALGEGIACGFEVEATSIGGSSIREPLLEVRGGLAVNRRGETVALDRTVQVSLLKPAATTAGAAPPAGGFGTCAPPEDSVYVTGSGVYLLSVAPAQARQGLALVSGLGNEAARCNARELVRGVQFRLFQVKTTGAQLADEARLRNLVAYRFLLAGGLGAGAVTDPFGTPPAPAALTQPALTDCDVPLAVLHWTATGGVRFVDTWSVRRLLAPGRPGEGVAAIPGAARLRAAEAALRQFQRQVAELAASGVATDTLAAGERFRYLPAAGLLPLAGLGAATGFDRQVFFAEQARSLRGPIVIEGAELPALLRASLDRPPIDLEDRLLIWIYLVRENLQALGTGAQPYFVFASGQIPPFGAARADVARAGFANVPIF